MAVGKRVSVLLVLALSFACVPAATRAAESEAAPTAEFTITPESPEVETEVTFDGSASSDPDGTIESYSWKFGDSSTGTGKVASHVYSKKGPYTVTLTVEDGGHATGTQTK